MVKLAQTSDAARMDRHYRFQRWIYDSTRTHYLLGRNYLLRALQPGDGQSVLEIGCGTAWNLGKLAKRYPQTSLYGVDVSNAMLETARLSLRRKGLENHVRLEQGDATNFDPQALFGHSAFDRVFFSYALSMIPAWEVALEHAAQLVAPGGSLHIVDFGQCERLPTVFKAGLFAFLSHYTVRPRENLEYSVREVADRHGLNAQFFRRHRGYTDYTVLARS